MLLPRNYFLFLHHLVILTRFCKSLAIEVDCCPMGDYSCCTPNGHESLFSPCQQSAALHRPLFLKINMSYLFGSWLFINLFWVNGYDITIYEACFTPVWIPGPMMWLACQVDILESVLHPGMDSWAYDVKSTLNRSLISLFCMDWYDVWSSFANLLPISAMDVLVLTLMKNAAKCDT